MKKVNKIERDTKKEVINYILKEYDKDYRKNLINLNLMINVL